MADPDTGRRDEARPTAHPAGGKERNHRDNREGTCLLTESRLFGMFSICTVKHRLKSSSE